MQLVISLNCFPSYWRKHVERLSLIIKIYVKMEPERSDKIIITQMHKNQGSLFYVQISMLDQGKSQVKGKHSQRALSSQVSLWSIANKLSLQSVPESKASTTFDKATRQL